jgi:dipeptidyl aminopeptidase/acylaminoacyl peptidase
MRIDDLFRFSLVSDPQVSPDGRKIAFVRTEFDYKNDAYRKHIWIWDRGLGKTNQFTFGAGLDTEPRWSPSGKDLLFLSSNRETEKKPQLYVIRVDGGEAHLVVDLEEGVRSPAWSPDSKHVLFLSRVWTDGKPKSDVKVIKRIRYRENGVGFFPGLRTHLFVSSMTGGKPKQLTKGEFDIQAARWSPNGQQIAVVTNIEKDADFTNIQDIFLLGAKGGEMTRLTRGKHVISNLSWAPSGVEIAYLGHDFHVSTATDVDIWIQPLDGSDSLNLTESFDRSLGRSVAGDLRPESSDPCAVWSPDSDALYFMTGMVPRANIYRIDRVTREIKQLTKDKNVEGFSLSRSGSVIAYTAGDALRPADVWVVDEKGERQATFLNDKLLKKLNLSTQENFLFRNELGRDIDYWIMKPPDFQPNKKYPAILTVHGGPMSIYGDTMFHEFQVFAAEGYVLLYTNPRGSGGYEEEYAAVLQGQFGEPDYRDLMKFMDDALKRFSFIDSKHLGVCGGSYGGFMTNWIVTHTDRFQAAVADRSTCNRLSHFGSSDMGYKMGTSGNMGYPWKDEEKLMRQSPIRYAANVKTPTLLIQSENDLRCNIEQAEEFFAALKELRVETEFVRFPDETHELSRSGKPKHREERLQHYIRWFNKFLK